MKPFNLEEYLKNPKRKVITRDGRPVRIICTDKCDTFGKLIIALIKCDNDVENIHTYTSDGTYFPAGGLFLDFDNNYLDLFFAPEKHEGWINVYKWGENYRYTEGVFSSKEKALKSVKGCDNVATIKIEWEE